VLSLTAAAREDDVPKFPRATPRDGAEHLPLLQGNPVRVLKKKRLAMLPQTVGD